MSDNDIPATVLSNSDGSAHSNYPALSPFSGRFAQPYEFHTSISGITGPELFHQRMLELESEVCPNSSYLANGVPNSHPAVELACTQSILARVSRDDDQPDLFFLDFIDAATKLAIKEPPFKVTMNQGGSSYPAGPIAPGIYDCDPAYSYRVHDKESEREVAVSMERILTPSIRA